MCVLLTGSTGRCMASLWISPCWATQEDSVLLRNLPQCSLGRRKKTSAIKINLGKYLYGTEAQHWNSSLFFLLFFSTQIPLTPGFVENLTDLVRAAVWIFEFYKLKASFKTSFKLWCEPFTWVLQQVTSQQLYVRNKTLRGVLVKENNQRLGKNTPEEFWFFPIKTACSPFCPSPSLPL